MTLYAQWRASPGWFGTWIFYNVAFTIFACGIVVQFLRKRNEYFIKARYPGFAIAQLILFQFTWIAAELISPFVGSLASCYFGRILSEFLYFSAIEVLFWRMWLLYWKVFFGKYLAERRKKLMLYYERQSAEVSKRQSAEFNKTVPTLAARKSARFYFAKYTVPVFFALMVLMQFVGSIVPLSQNCDDGDDWIQLVRVPKYVLFLMFFTMVVLMVRKYQDNYKLANEFRRGAVVFWTSLLVSLSLLGTQPEDVVFFYSGFVVTIAAQCFFVVAGVLPLLDQRRMERRIAAGDTATVAKLDAVLKDPAALVSLENFMKKEWCEENLEFYLAVQRFKDAFELQHSGKNRYDALILFATYIDHEAPSQVNISSAYFKEICFGLFGTGDRPTDLKSQIKTVKRKSSIGADQQVSFTIFDDAQREMHKLMKTGPFERFCARQDLRGRGVLQSAVPGKGEKGKTAPKSV